MYNFKEDKQPEYGQPIVWVVVEKSAGHTNAHIAEFDESLEAQFLSADIDVFWYPAAEVYEAVYNAGIRSANMELTEIPKRQQEIQDRKLQIVEKYDTLIKTWKDSGAANVQSFPRTATSASGDSSNGGD